MHFKRTIKLEHGLAPIIWASLVNVFFLLLAFFMLLPTLSVPLGINVRLPKAITSDAVKENIVITLTAEDIIYFNNSVYTIKDLREEMIKPGNRQRSVLIKADRHASVGRIVDVWDLCRQLKIERVHLATNH